MSAHPASYRRQDWVTILIVFSFTFLSTFIGLLLWSWSWFISWPDLKVHAVYWLDGLMSLVLTHSLQAFINYWDVIIKQGWHWALVTHLTLPALLSFIAANWFARHFYVSGGRDGYRHISGPQLYQCGTALNHAMGRTNSEAGSLGLLLHPELQISRSRESGNILAVGSQGSGKTVFIAPLISQVIERGERAFIYDEKREFTALFYKNESCTLIAPWDERGVAWDVQADARNSTEAQLIAERLIDETRDPLWSSGARMIFTGMIEILNHTQTRWGWCELAAMLSKDETIFHSELELYYPRATKFIVEDSKTTQSFYAQLLGSLGWIITLAEAWPKAYENGFSVRDWVNNAQTDKPIIIVQADKRYKNIGAPLANTIIAIMTGHILAETNSTGRELWLFIDELGNLPKNLALIEWMSLGRSKGCRICAGTQSISQLKHIYSEQEADTLLNMFTVFVSMRLGAVGETAIFTAKAFGERVVERPTSSAGPQGNTTQNWHRESLSLVTATDLVHLPQPDKNGVEGYLLIPGYNAVYHLRWPYTNLPIVSEEHCPASWLAVRQTAALKSNEIEVTDSRRHRLKQRREAI
ncbi:type IV secretion system DNA-binding domain-containing protein [Shewanella sp. PP-He15 brown]